MARVNEYYYNEHDENQVNKIYRSRKKKRLKKKLKIFIVLLILGLIAFYFLSDYSKVKSVVVTGNQNVSQDLILENAQVDTHDYYLFLNKSQVKKNVELLGMIKTVNVSCDFFGHVSIQVSEATPVAYCVIDDTTYIIDELGKVSECTNQDLITSLYSSPRLTEFKDLDFLQQFAKEYVKIPDIIKNQTSDIIYSPQKYDETRVEFLMNNGKKLYLRVEDMVDQLNSFDYEAHMEAYQNKCIFSFEGRNVYTQDCE